MPEGRWEKNPFFMQPVGTIFNVVTGSLVAADAVVVCRRKLFDKERVPVYRAMLKGKEVEYIEEFLF